MSVSWRATSSGLKSRNVSIGPADGTNTGSG
jgi:hypothetical protein